MKPKHEKPLLLVMFIIVAFIFIAAMIYVSKAEAKPKAKTVPATQVEDIMRFNCYKVKDGGVCDVHTNRKEANGFLPLIRLSLQGVCKYQRECAKLQEGWFCQGSFVCPDEVLFNDFPLLRLDPVTPKADPPAKKPTISNNCDRDGQCAY